MKSCQVDHRTGPRHRLLQRCFVRCWGRAETWRCIAYNISVTGIGITLPVPMPEGTVLEIEAWELPRARKLRVRVVQSKQVDFLWFCGCELTSRLSEAEVRTWQMGPRDWLKSTESTKKCS